MMRSSVYNVLDKLNELEKKMDRLHEKADLKEEEGKEKSAAHYTRDAEDIGKQIEGMVSCLKMLGLGAWRECGYDTKWIGKWHIPMDDIERVC